MSEPAAPRRARAGAGWLALALLLVWTAGVHHGIGPAPQTLVDHWYTPRAFLFESGATAGLVRSPTRAFAVLALPAFALAAAVAVGTGSALAAALATSCAVATALFVFYGVVARFPWQFFGWRGSAVLLLVGLAVGFALTAPWLARSWLALSWPARVAVYAPFVAAIAAFLRNATGTDPALPFAISPWPAVPVFGLELAALLVAIGLAGTALGVAGSARSRGAARARAGLPGWVGAAALPPGLVAAGSALHGFPFRAGAGLLAALALASVAAVAVVSRVGARDRAALSRRARSLAVGAALVGLPILASQAWAWTDYHRTREILARRIIDALKTYVARESLYPDSLDALTVTGDLAQIPEPAIGFSFLYDGRFGYQSFGTSYLLEFPAPRWVQCAYTPAPLEEDLDAGERAELQEDGGLEEAWSCPSRPPELW